MSFLVIMTGRDCYHIAERAIRSVADQKYSDYRVCLVDDASDDERMGALLTHFANGMGWELILNKERRHVLANQIAAWKKLKPRDEDVLVWVDLDDRLAHERVFGVVQPYYDRGAWLTYGSYAPDPASHPFARTCVPARPYPEHVVRFNLFRSVDAHFNHLRTVSWRVLKHLTDEDLSDDGGQPWRANADASVMMPCLELAGEHAMFIPDVLYKYTCDSPAAVWRTQRERLQTEWRQLRARQPKNPL